MATGGEFEKTTTEYVACSRQPGKAYGRNLERNRDGTVTLYGIYTPLLTIAEIFDLEPHKCSRQHRGEVGVLSNVNPACPYCGNRFVFDCPQCGMLSCCADVIRNKCAWCGVVGTCEITPERPERRSPGNVVWSAWIEFNEWVYDLMTRKNRPKTMREVEENYRKLKKP